MVRSFVSFKLTGYKLGMRTIAGNIFLSRWKKKKKKKCGMLWKSFENWLLFQTDDGHMEAW